MIWRKLSNKEKLELFLCSVCFLVVSFEIVYFTYRFLIGDPL